MIKTPLFLVNNETVQLGSRDQGPLNRNYFNITSQSSLNSHDPNIISSEDPRNLVERNNEIEIC